MTTTPVTMREVLHGDLADLEQAVREHASGDEPVERYLAAIADIRATLRANGRELDRPAERADHDEAPGG